MKRLAIFASGNGTNAANLIQYFRDHDRINVEVIVCNNPAAGVIAVAEKAHIGLLLINRKMLYETGEVIELLKQNQIDLIVLAGFLWMIPENLLRAFPDRIINIHPALLPSHGGAGMYGMKVHNSVISAKEKVTGITIHYVNEQFDAGEIIFQKRVAVQPADTAETIAKKVQDLEHVWYPQIIENILVVSEKQY